MALFQDTTANALAAVDGKVNDPTVTSTTNLKLTHTMTSGTTSATTFKIRAGTAGAATTTFNGNVGGRKYGGVMASSIVISEMAP
jgi:hypothetical protein